MANYKYKLSELAKKASADDAEKELGIPKSRFKVGQVSFSSMVLLNPLLQILIPKLVQ